MSSAAEAIASATPPAPRSAPPKAAATGAPSFEDHLAAEAPEETAPARAEQPGASADGEKSEEAAAKQPESKESEPAAPDTPAVLPTQVVEPPAPAIMVQLIAQTGGQDTPAEDAASAAPDEIAPTNDAAPENFGKALEKGDARETLPAQNVDAAPTSPSTDAKTPPPAITSPLTVQSPVATTTKPASKAAMNEAPSAEIEGVANSEAAETQTIAPRPVEPKLAETPRVAEAGKADATQKSDDNSVQDKLAAAIDGAAPQAKASADRMTPTPVANSDVAAAKVAPDVALPPVGVIGATQASTATTASAATVEHAAASRAAPAGAQVAHEIVRRFDGATTKFEMRLDPPELGRVEVRMEVTRDHKVTAVLAADSPQALTELVRHARELEQSLQSAGLELAENGLSFDLRQGGDDASQARDDDGPRFASGETESETAAPVARPIGLERWRGVRVDVMA